MGASGSNDENLPIEALKRADALATLREGPLERSELMRELDVSRTTIHRIVRGLESRDVLVQDGSLFKLTSFGQTVADEVT
ncbi:helix-turn-helix domain-containing protein, partial [Haloferax profundi]|uniref:helix-turn-helix domain-containing protein n=1 Tax=Haloferax profundi TaxID=1544718 RepID=UPI000AA6A98B